jgi:hypothetical protein
MTDFVEGAVYVSPSSNQAFIYREPAECLYPGGNDDLIWIGSEDYPPPDDLVCIWKPGDQALSADRLYGRRARAMIMEDHLTGAELEIGQGVPTFAKPPTKSPVEFELEWQRRSRELEHELCPSGIHVQPQADRMVARINYSAISGWFYPTRLNERLGRYEDELKREWVYQELSPGSNQWHLTGTDTWYKIPLDDRHPAEVIPIAVRWVGEHDTESGS